MITAREVGRRLEVIVGGGDDKIVFSVPPIPAKLGAKLLSIWIDISFEPPVAGDEDELTAQAEKYAAAAVDMAKLALGEANYDKLEDLRQAEAEGVMYAAFFWNVHGGSIDMVQDYLTEGLPKAQQALLEKQGLWDAYSLQKTLLDSVSETLMSTAASLDTSTPSGSETSSTGDEAMPTPEGSTDAASGDTSSPTGTTS